MKSNIPLTQEQIERIKTAGHHGKGNTLRKQRKELGISPRQQRIRRSPTRLKSGSGTTTVALATVMQSQELIPDVRK